MSPTIHRHTPTVAAVDARRLPVRAIAYYHRTLSKNLAQARVNRQAYDGAGRVIAQWDPRLWALAQTDATVPANQTSVYSLSGDMLASTSVDAGWRVNLPTESGQSLRSWDSRGSQSRFEYDVLLRPVAMFEQAPGESERCAERLSYADASPAAAASNLCGQLIRHDDPAGSQVVHEASLSGGILQQSRRFLSQDTLPDWPPVESQRDELLEPGAGAVTRQQYNPLGDPLQQTDAKGHRQRFAYTMAGQLHGTWLLLAGQAESDEQVLLSAIRYNAFDQVETETAGNGVVTTTRYSPVDGRLEHLLARKADGTCLQDLTYTYDPVGNILSIRDDAQLVRHFKNQRIEPVSTYCYDTLYQLIEATGRESAAVTQGIGLPKLQPTSDPNQFTNYTQTFSYDAGGNLTTQRHVGAQSYTREMQVAAHSNRSVVKDEGNLATAFDANGNLQQLQPGQALKWDLRNQLRQVTPVERTEAANDDEVYVYDGGGQRLRKIRSTQARSVTHRAEVRYLPGLELRTNTATGETLQVISVSAGRSGVRVLHWEPDQGPPEGMVNDQLRYSLSDHLGSSTLELDQQARLISQEGYYPYGGTAWWAGRNATEASYKTIRYSGKERDATGLYYYGLRYYAPWLNRWINPDPAGDVDGLNVYAMVGSNPIRYVDEEGTTKKESEMLKEIKAFSKNLSTAIKAVDKQNTLIDHLFDNKDRNTTIAKVTTFSVLTGIVTTAAAIGGGVLGGLAGTATLPGAGTAGGAGLGAYGAKKAASEVMKRIGKKTHLEPSITPKAAALSWEKIKEKNTSTFTVKYANQTYNKYDPRTEEGQKNGFKKVAKKSLKEFMAYGAKEMIQVGKLSEEANDAHDGLSPMKFKRLGDAYAKLKSDAEADFNLAMESFIALNTNVLFSTGGLTGGEKLITLESVKKDMNTLRDKIDRGLVVASKYAQQQGW